MIILAFAMLTPGTKFPEIDLFNFQDKAIHLICFFLQGYLWSGVGVKKGEISLSNPVIWRNVILFGIGSGIGFEFLQQFIPFRSFDLVDMITNVIGICLGLVGYLKWPFVKYILD
jgi:VanZ family protein